MNTSLRRFPKVRKVTFLWDMQIHTDRELSANKPVIVIKDHANRCCKRIDGEVPSDRRKQLEALKTIIVIMITLFVSLKPIWPSAEALPIGETGDQSKRWFFL